MKPIRQKEKNMMKKYLTLSLLFFAGLFHSLYAQSPHFYSMDENFELLQKFYKTDTVLVIFPDSESMSLSEKQGVEDLIFWGKKPIFNYKRECELISTDLEKHIQLYGAIFKFKNTYSKMPIQVNAKSFSYKSKSFSDNNDAFYYITDSAKILYTCRNSKTTLNPFSIYGVGAYNFYIFSNHEMRYTGYASSTSLKENINDIQSLKNQYFNKQSTKFFDVYIAKTLNADSVFNLLSGMLDEYVINLCKVLEEDTSNLDKMKLYIYANRIDLQKFIAAPLWSTVWGKCMGNTLHIYNVDIATIKHETAHSIIFQKIGYYSNPLFDEGFRQYTDYLLNESTYTSDMEITKNHVELLTNELLNGSVIFFNKKENYPISGIFIKYLVDKIGFSNFKAAFSKRLIDEYVKEKYNITTNELFEEFKKSI